MPFQKFWSENYPLSSTVSRTYRKHAIRFLMLKVIMQNGLLVCPLVVWNSHDLACLTSSYFASLFFVVFSITATAVKTSPNFNDTIGLKRQKNSCMCWHRTCLCRTCCTLISAVHSLTCSAKTTTTTFWRFCKFSFSVFAPISRPHQSLIIKRKQNYRILDSCMLSLISKWLLH